MRHDESRERAAELLAQAFPETIAAGPADLARICRSHPDLADELRCLAQGRSVEPVDLADLSARLDDRSIEVASDGEDSSDASWTYLVDRLRRHAPTSPRYRVDGVLGTGGMGTVYRVWDENLRRSLAMKVLRGDAEEGGSREETRALGRFVEEAQITGQLEHPGIVPVHELGIDDDGQVYFAMRRLSGNELRVELEALSGLSALDRDAAIARALGVILKACDAVAYAHSKGVLHRDLKPSNIMVGRFGEVYVVDWGLAKVLGSKERHRTRLTPVLDESIDSVVVERDVLPEGESWTPLNTVDGSVMGTPAFMPPEQASGKVDSLDETSDVYSMGAVLYNTLTGAPPYTHEVRHRSARAILNDVIAGGPKSVESIAPDVSPELRAICDKAMARRQRDRYPDMQALANDLRAFHENRVVSAYQAGALAELRKWVRRNREVAALMAAIVTIVIGGLIAYSWLQGNHASDISRENRKTAGLLDFVTDMLASADPTTGNTGDIRVRDMLDQSSARIGSQFDDSPELLADIHAVIARTYASLGIGDKMREHLEPELALRRELEPEGDERTVRVLTSLAEVELRDERLDEAERYAREGREMALRVLGNDHWASVSVDGTLGMVEVVRAGRDSGILPLIRVSARMATSYYGDGRTPEELELHFLALLAEGGEAMERGDVERVIDLLRPEVEPLFEQGDIPLREISVAFERGAATLESFDMSSEAEAMYVGAHGIAKEQLTAPDIAIAGAAYSVGAFYCRQRRFGDALPYLREACEGFEQTVGEDARTFDALARLAAAEGALGRATLQRTLLADASARAAIALGTASGSHASIELELAAMDLAEGSVENARDRLLPLAETVAVNAGRRGSRTQTEVDLTLARAFLELEDPEQARVHLERARVWSGRSVQMRRSPGIYRTLLELEVEFHGAVGDDARAVERRAELEALLVEGAGQRDGTGN